MISNSAKLWIFNLLLVSGVACIGYGVYGAFQPAESIDVEITDYSPLKDRVAGDPLKIPVEITNRTHSQIRLVGSDAC